MSQRGAFVLVNHGVQGFVGCAAVQTMRPMTHAVLHQEIDSKGVFFIAGPEGGRLAEMSYSRANPRLIIIDHTEVDASLAGQGIGRKLLDALVAWARETQTKVMPLCPYAKAQFDKDASIRDVLM
jgi:predicted GNAT family acetyltransferase